MEKKIARIGIISLAVILQLSFLPAIFSRYEIPQLLLVIAIAWTIIAGFRGILPWIIAAGVILDLLSFRIVGTSVIVLVFVSYFVSFFSRRFLVEDRGWGTLVMIFFIFFSTIFYHFYGVLFENSSLFSNLTSGSFWENFTLSPRGIFTQIIFNTLLFFLCYPPLARLEKYLAFYESKIKVT